ncbi:MAG TPA: polymer-forming cytoskeletal protein [Pyrinomonadaceae bacterium]|nr:polymer-forming cytoskeletal protein [Pyrinomonadaceae bacterium]
MFRPGRNPKEQQPHAEDTADHTPQAPAYGSGHNATQPASQTPAAGGGSSVTEAYQQSVHTPTASRAITESESLARDIKEGTLTGFVGNGTTLQGEAAFKGMLRVDGHLSGRISSEDGTLIVSTNGQVDANIEVAVAQIYGTVNGDITASKRIEMGRVAKVTGNIQTPALVIENGALFEGSCRMAQIKEAAEKRDRKDAAPVSASAPSASASSSSSAPSSSTSASSYGKSSSARDTPSTDKSAAVTDATGSAAS